MPIVKVLLYVICAWGYDIYPYLKGHNVRIHGIPGIIWPERLVIGDNVSLNGNFSLCESDITIGINVTLLSLMYGFVYEVYSFMVVWKIQLERNMNISLW